MFIQPRPNVNDQLLLQQPRWRHEMETFSALPVNSPHKGHCLGALFLFDLRMNKRLCKQSRRWWFEAQSRPLLRHCNDNAFVTKPISLTYYIVSHLALMGSRFAVPDIFTWHQEHLLCDFNNTIYFRNSTIIDMNSPHLANVCGWC